VATVLRSFDWSATSRNKQEARSVSYPWDQWFDGRIWQLDQGVDFEGPSVSMERVIRTTANRRRVRVRVRITEDDSVVLQKHEDEEVVRERTYSPLKRDLVAAEAAKAAAKSNGGHPTARRRKRIVPA